MSTDDRFDELGKALATSTSRRTFLKVAVAAAAGAVLSVVRVPEAAASHNRKCRAPGQNCTSDAQCCTHFCGPDFHCACAVACPGATNGVTTDCCAPGDACCGGRCISFSETFCSGGQIFNTNTCRCECPSGSPLCSGRCCASGQICCGNRCVAGPNSCASNQVFNFTTCRCECRSDRRCGSNCCNAGEVCCTSGPNAGQCRSSALECIF
jgi:hypothetical protein